MTVYLVLVGMLMNPVAKERKPEYRLVQIEQGHLGRFLKQDVEAKGAINILFSDVPDDIKKRLYRELGQAVRVSVVDRLHLNGRGGPVFDKSWTPRASIDGRTSGILDGKRLGIDHDYFYSIKVTLIHVGKKQGGRKREYLMNFELDLIGTGLRISSPWARSVDLSWHLNSVVPIERAMKALAKRKRTTARKRSK